MEYAVNYSTELVELLNDGAVAIDRFKCPAWLPIIAEAQQIRSVYVHFPLRIGTGRGDALDLETGKTPDWAKIDKILADTNTPFVNLHMALERDDFPIVDAGTPQSEIIARVIDWFLRDLEPVLQRYGPQKVIIENEYPYKAGRLVYASYPEVINSLIAETGAGFLLDLSHARIAADTLGMDEKIYIRALPTEHIRELHLTGIHRMDEGWLKLAEERNAQLAAIVADRLGERQDHLPFTAADWEMTEWALEQIAAGKWGSPKIAAMECGGVGDLFKAITFPEALAADIPRLGKLIQRASLPETSLT